jgi:Right handed beta helix region
LLGYALSVALRDYVEGIPMKITSSVIACSFLLALSTSAQALNTRSFISANGLDTNACTRTAPCRTLQVAHNNTAAGGEINMLDPAGYGTVTITKSISIVNDGVGSAGILVPSGQTGITINAGATDKVNLRGLIIEGAGVGATGIAFTSGQSLTIDNCVVRNLASNGIHFVPNASSSLAVSNTLLAANSGYGIYLQPSANDIFVFAVFNRVEAYNNGQTGIGVLGNVSTGAVQAIAADCVVGLVSEPVGSRGYWALGTSGTPTRFSVFRSLAFGYEEGVRAEGGPAVAIVSQSNLEGNALPFSESSGGLVFSYGDNYTAGQVALHTVSKH